MADRPKTEPTGADPAKLPSVMDLANEQRAADERRAAGPQPAGARQPVRAGRVVEAAKLTDASHFLTNTGRPIPNVVRVAFDGPAEQGMADVTVHVAGADGLPITYRDEAGELHTPEITFRAFVRVVPAGPR